MNECVHQAEPHGQAKPRKGTNLTDGGEGQGSKTFMHIKRKNNEMTKTLRSLEYAHIKKPNLKIHGTEGSYVKSVNEIITENLQNLEKEIDIHTQERFTTPNRHDRRRTTSQYTTVRMSKKTKKRKMTKSCKGKTPVNMQSRNVRIRSDL